VPESLMRELAQAYAVDGARANDRKTPLDSARGNQMACRPSSFFCQWITTTQLKNIPASPPHNRHRTAPRPSPKKPLVSQKHFNMTDDNIYVRFKGRTLGPLTYQKIQDLVRRGQITRMHDLSYDGMSWIKAEEFGDLFTSSRAFKSGNVGTANSIAPAGFPNNLLRKLWYSGFGQAPPRPNETPDQAVQWDTRSGGKNRGKTNADASKPPSLKSQSDHSDEADPLIRRWLLSKTSGIVFLLLLLASIPLSMMINKNANLVTELSQPNAFGREQSQLTAGATEAAPQTPPASEARPAGEPKAETETRSAADAEPPADEIVAAGAEAAADEMASKDADTTPAILRIPQSEQSPAWKLFFNTTVFGNDDWEYKITVGTGKSAVETLSPLNLMAPIKLNGEHTLSKTNDQSDSFQIILNPNSGAPDVTDVIRLANDLSQSRKTANEHIKNFKDANDKSEVDGLTPLKSIRDFQDRKEAAQNIKTQLEAIIAETGTDADQAKLNQRKANAGKQLFSINALIDTLTAAIENKSKADEKCLDFGFVNLYKTVRSGGIAKKPQSGTPNKTLPLKFKVSIVD